jgi:tRNA dimethylallyltransferase
MKPSKPVIILLGPTAVGKTDLSIDLAAAIGAEIISVDSRLLYRGMDIGTAKPSAELRERVRHHLIDVAEPGEGWSLNKYLEAARGAIEVLHKAGKIPLLVGGTGQYIAALVEGWQPPPKADDRAFRQKLRSFAAVQGADELHKRLEEIDPDAAGRIDPRNVRRVIRALEIHHVTGQLPSTQRKNSPPDYTFLMLGLSMDRDKLYKRIDKRIEEMLSSGWVEEVAELHGRGVDLASPALSAIGYRHITQYLNGEIDLETALEETRRLTRQFVRRQDTWFRRFEADIYWFDAEQLNKRQLIDFVQGWLAGGIQDEEGRSHPNDVSVKQED